MGKIHVGTNIELISIHTIRMRLVRCYDHTSKRHVVISVYRLYQVFDHSTCPRRKAAFRGVDDL
jgi:hypothetical protein